MRDVRGEPMHAQARDRNGPRARAALRGGFGFRLYLVMVFGDHLPRPARRSLNVNVRSAVAHYALLRSANKIADAVIDVHGYL